MAISRKEKKLQVSSDGACKFISFIQGKSPTNNKDWYRLNFLDETGTTLSAYCTPEVAGIASRLKFGQDITIVFRFDQGRTGGTFMTCTDIVYDG